LYGDTSYIIVVGNSMEPTFYGGDFALAKKSNDYFLGDIITFEQHNAMVIHRIVDKKEEGFVTKGDNKPKHDPWIVKEDKVVGKVLFSIPLFGSFISLMKNHFIFVFSILAALTIISIMPEEKKLSPSEARKKEREKRRAARRAIRIVNYKRFLMIFLFSTIIFGAVSLPSLAGSGYVTDINVGTLKIENSEALPGVCIFNIINDPHGEISISPGYAVLPPKSDIEVEIIRGAHETDTGGSGLEHEDAFITVSKSPYIIPVFWIDTLAKINPYLPGLVSSTIPPVILTLILFPIWFQRRVKYKYKYRRHLFKKLKRRLLTAIS